MGYTIVIIVLQNIEKVKVSNDQDLAVDGVQFCHYLALNIERKVTASSDQDLADCGVQFCYYLALNIEKLTASNDRIWLIMVYNFVIILL